MNLLHAIADRLGFEAAPAPVGSKAAARSVESPYTWPVWQEGEPVWTEPTLTGYTEAGYQGNAIIYACIARKAQTAAVAPLRLWMGDRAAPTPADDGHELARLLRRPNRWMSWFELQELLITYLELDGNAYLVKVRRSPTGPVEALFPLRPDFVRPVPRGGELLGYVYERDGKREPYLADEIIDVKYPNPVDPFEGLGRGRPPLLAAAYVGDVDNATTKFLRQFFDNAVVPFGLLKSKQKLLDGEVNRIRARIRSQYGGMSHWGDVMILDTDAEYQRLGLDMTELGFEHLDARNEARICSVLQVPPILVGAKVGLDRSTFANYGEARSSFWEDSMMPLYRRFSDQFTLQLVEPDYPEMWADYDFGDVPALRRDNTQKWETAVRVFLGGVAKRNEARALAGLPPAEEDGFRRADDQQVGAPAITRTPPETDPADAPVRNAESGKKAALPAADGDGGGDDAERRAIEGAASGMILQALQAQLAAITPGAEEAVTQMEGALTTSGAALRDALYRALRPAALLGVTSARRAVELATTGAAATKEDGGGAVAGAVGGAAITVDWTLVATQVLAWLDTYSFDLIRDLTETTRAALRAAIQRWAANGLPLSDLVDELVALGLFDRERAELIATTEVTRVYASAQILAWQQSGVVHSMRWNTANDERVCPICGALGGLEMTEQGTQPVSIEAQLHNGVVTQLGNPFVHPGGLGAAGRYAGQTFTAPPAHPRCRCWVTAVI